MHTILLMAGSGERFQTAGYTVPKPLLAMPDGRTLLAWVADRLAARHLTTIARESDRITLMPVLRTTAPIVNTIWLKATTGPLASLRAAKLTYGGPILIAYCDILCDDVAGFVTAAEASGAPSAVVTFHSTNPRFGYWDGVRVHEKRVVSPWAVSGVFWFADGRVFQERAQAIHDPQAGIPSLLDSNTFCYPVAPDCLADLGTPADYEAYCSAGVTP